MPNLQTAAEPPPAIARPIIILGAARSGTTMLGNLLSQHRTLHYMEEPRLIWRWGNDRRSDMLGPEHATDAICQHIRGRFRQSVEESGKPRLLEKSPSNTLRPAFVHRVFPDAKLIHITRHGLDSVLSLKNMTQQHAHGLTGLAPNRLRQRLGELEWTRLHHYAMEFARRAAPKPLRSILGPNPWGPRVPGIRALMKELHPLEVSAIQWRMCVEASHAYGRTLPADQFFEFKLEDMSKQVLNDLLRFVGLEDNAPVLDHFAKTFKLSYSGRQRREADPAEIKQIMTWIEPTLEWLGYD